MRRKKQKHVTGKKTQSVLQIKAGKKGIYALDMYIFKKIVYKI